MRCDYPNLARWLCEVGAIPGVSETLDVRAAAQSYYASLFPLNPSGIVPNIPEPPQYVGAPLELRDVTARLS